MERVLVFSRVAISARGFLLTEISRAMIDVSVSHVTRETLTSIWGQGQGWWPLESSFVLRGGVRRYTCAYMDHGKLQYTSRCRHSREGVNGTVVAVTIVHPRYIFAYLSLPICPMRRAKFDFFLRTPTVGEQEGSEHWPHCSESPQGSWVGGQGAARGCGTRVGAGAAGRGRRNRLKVEEGELFWAKGGRGGGAPHSRYFRTAPAEHVVKNPRANRAPHGDEDRLFVDHELPPIGYMYLRQ